MTRYRVVWCLAIAMVCAAQVLAAPQAASEAQELTEGLVFDLHDADRAIREGIDPWLKELIVQALNRPEVATQQPEQTARNAITIISGVLEEAGGIDWLGGQDRQALQAFSFLSALQITVQHHPELEQRIDFPTTPFGTPIEDICNCDKSSARACGCAVQSRGPGACNYKVLCGSFGRALCSAVALELCVAERLVEIVKG